MRQILDTQPRTGVLTAVHGQLQRLMAGLQDGLQPRYLPPAEQQRAAVASHRHRQAELFLQLAGKTRFRCPGTELLLATNELLILGRGQLHAERGQADDTGFQQLVVLPEPGHCRLFLSDLGPGARPRPIWQERLPFPNSAQAETWLQQTASSPIAAQRQGLVLAALADLLASWPAASTKQERNPHLVSACQALICEQLADPSLTVSHLARQLQRSPDHLSACFKRAHGETLGQHLQRRRLQRAQQLLAHSNDTIAVIAKAVGFRDPGYFSRLFRKLIGCTPRQWRQNTNQAATGLRRCLLS